MISSCPICHAALHHLALGEEVLVHLSGCDEAQDSLYDQRAAPRTVRGITNAIKQPLATVYKTVDDLVAGGLIEASGKLRAPGTVRNKSKVYKLTDRGRVMAEALRTLREALS